MTEVITIQAQMSPGNLWCTQAGIDGHSILGFPVAVLKSGEKGYFFQVSHPVVYYFDEMSYTSLQ